MTQPSLQKNPCSEILPLLSQFIDGELGTDQCLAIRSHLRQCESCQKVMDALRASIEAAREWLPCEDPAPLSDDTRAKLRDALQGALARRQNPKA